MKVKSSKKQFWKCAVAALTLTLTICSCVAPHAPAYGQATQPPYLYLGPGQTYTATAAEKWVSPKVIEQKDALILEQNRILERAGIQPFLPR